MPEILKNARQVMNGATLLAGLPDDSARLVIFDPQYRSVMDKQQYGNEGKRQIGRAALPQMSDAVITCMNDENARVLAPSGHQLLWVDKFMLGERSWARFFRADNPLKLVDYVVWDKGRNGMGKRSRIGMEAVLIFQKPPIRAKGAWRDHGIEDRWLEYADRSVHPHAKPLQLHRRLIMSLTKRNDVVVDPTAGGYGVLDLCQQTGRDFIGCDLLEAADHG